MTKAKEFFTKEKNLKTEVINTIITCVKQTVNNKIMLRDFIFEYYDKDGSAQESFYTQLELDENENLVFRVDYDECYEDIIEANANYVSTYTLIGVLFEIED